MAGAVHSGVTCFVCERVDYFMHNERVRVRIFVHAGYIFSAFPYGTCFEF